MKWAFLSLRRYLDFQGRSGRREYWAFQLLVLGLIIFAAFAMFAFTEAAGQAEMEQQFTVWAGFALLPVIVPLFAVTARRLHDLGWSGWWLLALLVGGATPAIDTIAGLAYIIIMLMPGSKHDNRFGPTLREPRAA